MKHFFIALLACMLSVLMMRADEVQTLEIELTEAGTLAQKLEEHNILEVDTLAISGPMDGIDMAVLRQVSYEYYKNYFTSPITHSLVISVDLSRVQFENDTVPEEEEVDISSGLYDPLLVQSLTLPTKLKGIGKWAFQYANIDTTIIWPESLTTLGEGAFCYATINRLCDILPEGIVDIPDFCFFNAGTGGVLKLPSTVRTIGFAAFYGSGYGSYIGVILPEGLREIKGSAFARNETLGLNGKLIIPSTCLTLGDNSFYECLLFEVSLPAGLREIPRGCFSVNRLYNLQLPESLKVIGDKAFYNGLWNPVYHGGSTSSQTPIYSLDIPEGLHTIGRYSFAYAPFKSFKFPSTTKTVGCGCLKNGVTGDILIASSTPPECLPDLDNPTIPIFAGLENHTLYVPVGAAEAYRQAYGWSEFTDIREDPNLKDSSAAEICNDTEDAPLYDLSGREVLNPQKGQICISRGHKMVNR